MRASAWTGRVRMYDDDDAQPGFSAASTQSRMAIMILYKLGMIDHGIAWRFTVVSILAEPNNDDPHLDHLDQP